MMLISSINFQNNKILNLEFLMDLINQKINICIFIFFIYQFLNNQHEYRALDPQSQRKSKQLTLDQVLVLQTPINNSIYELSHGIDINFGQKELLDHINEGVMMAKFLSLDDKISNLQFKFQNAAAQTMFCKENDELPQFLDQLQCEIPIESNQSQQHYASTSPHHQDKSDYQKKLFVSQSNFGFSLQEKKSFSPNSKIAFFQQQQSSDSVVQCKTVYQHLIQYAKTNKNCTENEAQCEPLKLCCTYEDNGKQKSIEFICLLGLGKQIIIITRDIIYLNQLKELLQVNQQKSNMLNYVSHEFRTPLNCIINVLQSVLDKVQVNQDQLLHIALESSQHLLNLANDLLDLAQIKNNVFNLTNEQFNVSQLAQMCLNSFQIQAAAQNVKISLAANSDQLFIKSDKNRIKQILINLIGNALKFTYDGKIEIVLRQYDQFIDIGVRDTGIGISQENISKLFKAFGRVDNDKSKSMNQQGVGLGLLISNKIAKQLSADNQGIKVQSTEMKYENHGSYFYFTVKMESHRQHKLLSYKPPQKQINLSSPFIPSEGTQKKKSFTYTSIEQRLSPERIKETKCFHILLVDDNVFNLAVLGMMINEYFQNEIYLQLSIEKANNGTQAVGLAFYKCNENCQGFSLIFMDMEMPGLNGVDASKIILAKNIQQKIIILTGNNLSQQEIKELKSIGIFDYIIKPIQKSKLQSILEQFITE
ncbi:unnamed protein product [Paramecium pentaurelia]|uniref:Uncharacterized protein n=1 Tax=Paramecium pentaurelia TaxID=43138 RepID=A0A8S1TH09_9CILI|nr:unnamed protein product [Paramecium pentaurelia]